MEPRISIITLGVNDLDAATKFYRDGLKLPIHDFPGEISFFKTSGTWLSLYPKSELAKDIGISSDGQGFSGITLAHNVKDLRKNKLEFWRSYLGHIWPF